jgi:transposase
MTEFQFVGVDVAKDKFDVALEIDNKFKYECFNNNKSGYRLFSKWLNKNTSTPWVCMEATGHYSELIADYLVTEAVKVSVVNPLQIKSFARAKLSRNKTDKIDSKLIAQYGQLMLPRTFVPRSAPQKSLKELSNLLDMLKMQHTQLQNQSRSAQSDLASRLLNKAIKSLKSQIDKVQASIASIIAENQSLKDSLELITSIKGVGKLTAYKILSHVPHLSNFGNAKQFAAFIGITPRQHQSGNLQGKTSISRLGNAALRKTFYMAALVAIKHNKYVQPFVNRLKDKGKAPKVIICAVMKKLAHLVFGVIKNQRPFNENYA